MKIGWLNKIQENLKEQYRLVVLHNATLKEKASWQFSLYRFFITLILLIIILIGITIALIAFTPLKEYIPGYGGIKHAQKIRILTQKLDSLEQIYNQYDYYEKNVRTILDGNVAQEDTISIDTTQQTQNLQPALTLSKTDSILLELNITPPVKSNKPTTTKIKPNNKENSLFFPPITGIVASASTMQGIFLDCKAKTSVYTPKSGTIIFQGQDIKGNQVIVIQHQTNTLSILHLPYSDILIKIGQMVKDKQAIAVLTKDQKVHYELWIDGKSVNPQDYIIF